MIAILDYDMGNVASIKNMLEHIGFEAMITHDFEQLNKASHLILPGVGSFDHGVNSLKERGLFDYLKQSSKPILGICLGMQLLGNQSEEGNEKGLELIDFDNVKFKFEDQKLKVPHMGWNNVEVSQPDNPLLINISN
jgi:imidazole glycerol-phosphate synthase subunit HisH